MSQIICTICGQPVSKRQSYAYGGGRACKVHQEAAEHTQARLDKEEAARKTQKEAAACKSDARHKHGFFGAEQAQSGWSRNHCWICEKEGFAPDEVPVRLLISMQKLWQEGTFNIFDVTALQEAAGFHEIPPLTDFELTDRKIYDKVHQACERHTTTLLEFLHIARLCGQCAETVGINVRQVLEDRSPTKTTPLETLYLVGMVYEESDMAKKVEKIAALENSIKKSQ